MRCWVGAMSPHSIYRQRPLPRPCWRTAYNIRANRSRYPWGRHDGLDRERRTNGALKSHYSPLAMAMGNRSRSLAPPNDRCIGAAKLDLLSGPRGCAIIQAAQHCVAHDKVENFRRRKTIAQCNSPTQVSKMIHGISFQTRNGPMICVPPSESREVISARLMGEEIYISTSSPGILRRASRRYGRL